MDSAGSVWTTATSSTRWRSRAWRRSRRAGATCSSSSPSGCPPCATCSRTKVGGMTPAWRKNRITDLLGIRYPILTGAFGGLSSVALTATVSEGGGLGAYGLYGYSPEQIKRTVADLRAATSGPFLLNLWVVDEADAAPPDPAALAAAAERLRPFYADLGIEVPPAPARLLPSFPAQVDAVLEARPA